MNFAQYIPLFGAIINFAITILVISRDVRAPLHRVFAVWGLAISTWNLGTFFMFRVQSEEEALFWARFLQYGVIFIPGSLFHLSLMIAEIPLRRWAWLLYGTSVALAISNTTPLFISTVKNVGYAYYSVAGPAFWALTVFLSLTVASVLVLGSRLRQLPPLQRRRLLPLIFAQSVLTTLGLNDILPILGTYYYPFTTWQVFPFGSLAAVFYGLVVSYSVLQHQLLNVHISLSHWAAHSVRFAFVFAIGLLLQLLVTVFAPPHQYTPFAFISSLGVIIATTLIGALLFPKLLGSRSEQLERKILGDRFEYQDQVRIFIERMTWYPDLPSLLNDLHILLLRTFRLESYRIILRDETNLAFAIVKGYPEEYQGPLDELKISSPVFRYFEQGTGEYLSLNRAYFRLTTTALENQARAQLASFEAEFCFPLAWQNEPFGLLLAGKKVTQDPFTATDISLLVELAKNMSVVANQMRLKTQILQAQELDLLGRMSRGMAHDLNNLLTPVSTLLQLASETGTCDEELLPTALRNVTTMRAYIKESLFFSEHPRPDLRLARLDAVVKQTVELARSSRKKQVDITAETPGEVVIEMNEVLIQRLLTNIISNAIDASTPDGLIQVRMERLAGVEASRDWVRLRVIDHGEGISREDLDRVQTPYFTTKNRGDETRGFGLGLAICRKIVALHGGRLSIESQLRQGTTVQVDLPIRQLTAETSSLLSLTTPAR